MLAFSGQIHEMQLAFTNRELYLDPTLVRISTSLLVQFESQVLSTCTSQVCHAA